MVCPGGELAFVTQMVKDSIKLQGRVHWYTSMVGKKATLKQLRRLLHNSRVTALRTTEFVQVSSDYCIFTIIFCAQGLQGIMHNAGLHAQCLQALSQLSRNDVRHAQHL